MSTSVETAIDRFTARAAEEGMLDVAYTRADSPFGPLLLAQTKKGLVRVGLPNQDSDELLVDLAERVSPRVLEAPKELDEVRRELDLYFEGKLDSFDLPLDWRLSGGFRQRVLRA
ncbi:MAG TPA: cysteine methyltransferase, partial [Solirubrobacterales bacterium]